MARAAGHSKLPQSPEGESERGEGENLFILLLELLVLSLLGGQPQAKPVGQLATPKLEAPLAYFFTPVEKRYSEREGYEARDYGKNDPQSQP